MPIPADLLAAAATHPCFSGVYDYGHRIQMHQAGQGPVHLLDFQCEDCLSFRLACHADDLPQGMSHSQAATLITEHVRRLRGYLLSVGGYHTVISGWLSAAYWDAAGIFILHTDRGSNASQPALDVLIHAMQKGLVKPSHPAMPGLIGMHAMRDMGRRGGSFCGCLAARGGWSGRGNGPSAQTFGPRGYVVLLAVTPT